MKKLPPNYRREHFRYAYAYLLAAGLTLLAFMLVEGRMMAGKALAIALLAAAAAQLYIQSRYFLHLDETSHTPRWKLASYLFTWLTLLIVVVGSLWVVYNMNYNMGMGPTEMLDYMMDQNSKGF